MELNEKQFIIGFNSGYLLARYEPQVLPILFKNIQTFNSYITGLSCGQKEFEMEQTKTHLDELKQIRQKNMGERDNERE